MNKKSLIIVVVVILLILGGGVFAFMGRSHMSSSRSSESAKPQAQTQQASTQKKSLFDFFSMAGSQKCTFSDKTDNSSGTVYVSTGKMRGDFLSTNNGQSAQSHMINDGNFVYYWTDGQKSGYKMALSAVKDEAAQSTSSNNTPQGQTPSQAVNMQQKADYSCGAWAADASVFTAPSDVTFTDYSAMMQEHNAGGVAHPGSATMQGSQATCSECDQVPAGAARNQCRAALKCQ